MGGNRLAVVFLEEVCIRLLREGFHEEDFGVGKIIDSGTDSFEVDRSEYVVDISDKLVGCPSIFAVLVCNIEVSNPMTVEGRVFPIDQNVMAIDPHSRMIV